MFGGREPGLSAHGGAYLFGEWSDSGREGSEDGRVLHRPGALSPGADGALQGDLVFAKPRQEKI